MNIISQSLWVRNFGWLSWGFPGGSSGKELARQCRRHERLRFNPWVGKTPGVGNGNPLTSCLENYMDRGAWQATIHGVAKSQ